MRVLLQATMMMLVIGGSVPAKSAPRHVLVESFSNVGSEASRLSREALQHSVPQPLAREDVVFVNYHAGWPESDPLYAVNSASIDRRLELYGVDYLPTARLDGRPWFDPQAFGSYDEYARSLDARISLDAEHESLVGLGISANVNRDLVSAHVAILAEPSYRPKYSSPLMKPRLLVALLGNGTSGSSEFLGFLTGPLGDAIELTPGASVDRNYLFSVQSLPAGTPLGAIAAWVDEGFGAVANATISPITSAPGAEAEPLLDSRLQLTASSNPFRPSLGGLDISYNLPKVETVRLDVFDLFGARVATLDSGARAAGLHRVTWSGIRTSGEAATTGLFVVRLHAGADTRTLKVFLLR